MDIKIILNEFARSPFFDFAEYETEFDNQAHHFLNFLLLSKLDGTQEINIGTFTELQNYKIAKKGAHFAYDDYFPDDKELTLRYSDESGFEMLLCYYSDSMEKRISHIYNLSSDEIERLPKGLVDVMKSVKETMKELKISPNALRGSK